MPGDVPSLIKARRGFTVSYGGKNLLSKIDPVGQAEQLADSLPMQDRTLYFCPSPLLGYGLEKLLGRMPPNSALLCIEADEQLFRLSLENFSAALKTDKRLRLSDTPDKTALCVFVRRTWGERYFRRVVPVRLGGGWRLFPELYNSLEETLRREIALDWGNALTLTKLGRLYIRHTLRNLALIPRYPSIAKLSFGGAPVLVLGAGPSLDALLEGLIRRFGEELYKPARPFRIVCADTCLPALRARNIRPDLAVILESQHWNLRDFIGLGGWQIRCAVDLSALPLSAKLPWTEVYLFFTPWTELRLFKRLKQAGLLPETVPPLGSVGLSAAAIALLITSGPVLVGGMDFSFTVDSYHARSTPGHLDKLTRQNRFQSLFNAAAFDTGAYGAAAKSGERVQSSPAMRNYRNLFEQEFAAEPRLFDTVSCGLPLGLKTLSAEEFFDRLHGGAHTAEQADETEIRRTADAEILRTAGESLAAFIRAEKGRLAILKNTLTGMSAVSTGEMEALIDECDYLWAHFPDYAGTGGRRPKQEDFAAGTPPAISFLKRVRAEIESALKIYESEHE
jgi:hypothetical protein